MNFQLGVFTLIQASSVVNLIFSAIIEWNYRLAAIMLFMRSPRAINRLITDDLIGWRRTGNVSQKADRSIDVEKWEFDRMKIDVAGEIENGQQWFMSLRRARTLCKICNRLQWLFFLFSRRSCEREKKCFCKTQNVNFFKYFFFGVENLLLANWIGMNIFTYRNALSPSFRHVAFVDFRAKAECD